MLGTWALGLLLLGCAGATSPAGDAAVDSYAMDGAGPGCRLDSDCPTDQRCVFGSAGCGLSGTCATHRLCSIPPAPYCGCDGITFFDECEGPTHPWTSAGYCPDAGLADASADAARACHSAAECGAMQDCIFASPGCSQVGVCTQSYGCGRPSLPYCGCSGATFSDTCEGPGQPWTSMGACPDAGATCGTQRCGVDEVCVNPCCGGPAPLCVPRDDAGACPPGTSVGFCSGPGGPGMGCTMQCTPSPPFCAPRPASGCTGNACAPCPGGGGLLTGDQVRCLCA